MKLIHDSINIAETKDLETLKNQVKACIFIKLQEKDMSGFFGDMCRYASIIGQGGRFHTFNREFNGEQDWEIMKACLINAGNLDTLVNYKWAVYRENEGWRCVIRPGNRDRISVGVFCSGNKSVNGLCGKDHSEMA